MLVRSPQWAGAAARSTSVRSVVRGFKLTHDNYAPLLRRSRTTPGRTELDAIPIAPFVDCGLGPECLPDLRRGSGAAGLGVAVHGGGGKVRPGSRSIKSAPSPPTDAGVGDWPTAVGNADGSLKLDANNAARRAAFGGSALKGRAASAGFGIKTQQILARAPGGSGAAMPGRAELNAVPPAPR